MNLDKEDNYMSTGTSPTSDDVGPAYYELETDGNGAIDRDHSSWLSLAVPDPAFDPAPGSELQINMALIGIADAAPDSMSDSLAKYEHSSLCHIESFSMNWEEI